MPFKNEHPLYRTWKSMKDRCTNKNSRQWKDYGGRGIAVCARWLGKDGFRNFLTDMGDRPEGHSLDRIDNNKNYEPDNCKWSTRKEQQRNRRVVVRLVIDGKEYIAAELAEMYGFKTDSIIARARKGLSFDEVVCRQKRVYKDGLALGGIANGLRQKSKTHCPQGHPYTDGNVIYSPEGHRRCKICKRALQRRINARNREKMA